MKRIKEIELIDIINELPDITQLNCKKDFSNQEYDLFFCALGFEDRCLTIPELLANAENFKCNKAYYFEYSTNREDNEINKPRLLETFKKFTNSWNSFQCDSDEFPKRLRDALENEIKIKSKPKVIFDISVCSSKLLLLAMKIFLEFDICLKIVYSEAALYHPTVEEYKDNSQDWSTEEGFGIAKGVGLVTPSPEHPGARKENPDLIISFLTFKPERTKAIIADIDDSLLKKPNKRLICIIGDPHMDEPIKTERKKIMREINKEIMELEGVITFEISTFDYKETLKKLEQIYKEKYTDFHINISALGSKMQTLGVSLFYYLRPDVSIYFALPEKYNPKQYSKGCKATWQIDFDDTTKLKELLNKVGKIEIING